MKMYLLLIVLTVSVVFSERTDYNYCKVPTCSDPEGHVFCKYTTNEISKACGDVSQSRLTEKERTLILKLHNDFRFEVYTGRQTIRKDDPHPAARYPSYLHWDYELEDAAHRWSIQCINGKDICRDLEGYTVNQIVEGEAHDLNVIGNKEISLEDLIRSWYNKGARVAQSQIRRFDSDEASKTNSHQYTQMLWGNTKKIGCNVLRHTSGGYKILTSVCNYGPAGNIPGEPVYIPRY